MPEEVQVSLYLQAPPPVHVFCLVRLRVALEQHQVLLA